MKVQVPVNVAMAEVLEAAAEYVNAGWTQHRPFEAVDGKTYVCANGAMWLAAGLPVDDEEVDLTARAHEGQLEIWLKTKQELSGYIGQDTASWNDSIGQTQDRVADTMLCLAKELRNDEQS